MSYADSNNNGSIAQSEIIEESNYYPFGLKHKGYNNVIVGTEHPYKYNGKELDEDLGLNWYHYGFRVYDVAIGRFPSIDPASDQFPHVSTYNYAENEPVGSIDLWGLQRWKVNGIERTQAYSKERKHSAERALALSSIRNLYRLKLVVGNKLKANNNTISAVSHRLSRTARGVTETNGIRHALGSALVTSEYDSGFAGSVTNAHEGLYQTQASEIDHSKPFEAENNEKGRDLADSVVDILNNDIGKKIGSEEGLTNKEIMLKVLDIARTDGLYSFRANNKDGKLEIYRNKLSDNEYNSILERLNKLDDNGRVKKDNDKK